MAKGEIRTLAAAKPPAIRRTRSSLAKAAENERQADASVVIDDSDAMSHIEDTKPGSRFFASVILPVTKNGKALSTSSTSSASDEVSDHSTPATSAVATPISNNLAYTQADRTSNGSHKRPRRAVASVQSAEAPVSKAFERANKLRESGFMVSSTKRKRVIEESDADDSDVSPDAQLARALQDEENAKINEMEIDDSDAEDLTPRRTKRAFRVIKPKRDFDFDLSEDDEEVFGKSFAGRRTTKVKKIKTEVDDSEASEFEVVHTEVDSDDSADLSKASIAAALTTSRKAQIKSQLKSIASTIQPISSAKGKQIKLEDLATTTPLDYSEGSELSELDDAAHDALLAADSAEEEFYLDDEDEDVSDLDSVISGTSSTQAAVPARAPRSYGRRSRRRGRHAGEDNVTRRARQDRERLELHHPELLTMWDDLRNLPAIKKIAMAQPTNINRELKPFQLEGVAWMRAMEDTEWGGGLLGDEMGMGKTIQAVSLIMSDYPQKQPSLVLIPPVALMQWQQEIGDYTDGTLKTFVFHGTNAKSKNISAAELKKYDVILMSYNSLESMYRHQEKGRKRKDDEGLEVLNMKKSEVHKIKFHRVILDEAHNIKQRTTGVAKACFALKADHKWCLSGTPLQNRIGEFFSLVRFLDIQPFSCYMCKQCPCTKLEWGMDSDNRCTGCKHSGMQHVSVFNQELLNPIQKYGNKGPGKVAFEKLRLLTDRFMLRRVKRDHSSSMELPAKEIIVDRQFFGEVENDFAGSIMNNSARKFETYVAQGVMLNNYANIFGLIMQMRQVADHPDLILKKDSEGGANILNCCICDETAEDAIRSSCKHDFCRQCVKSYMATFENTGADCTCPRCHISLSIDIEQPEIEQDEQHVKKSSIINRIKMENWTSSSKIEALVHDLHSLRSNKSSSKSIIFSQFTTMLQLVEWRLRRAGITTVMLDGSMTPAQRQASINTFMTDVNVECFLVSLKAGGVALNLTEASKVFLIDPWWNPAAEWQSADRCHRIGQCRPCTITRLCIEDSVESRMVLLQEKKANMINSTINSDEQAMENLTPEDMQFLFRGT